MTSASNRNGLDRRTFIAGVAATGFLAACGSEPEAEPFSLIQRFPQNVTATGEVRLPFSLADGRAGFTSDGPDELRGRVTDLDGVPLGEPLVAVRRDVTPFPYYAFRTRIDAPGFYTMRVEGGPEEGASFQVLEPGEVGIPLPGDQLAGFDTPTPGSPGGVDPICTRTPACEFHSITLEQALAGPKQVAYFIGTPALCPTGSCTPALESVIEAAPDFADRYDVVHAEVYSDLTGITIAPAVESLGLTFEPALFITDTQGVVRDRLDGLWDITELRERLDANAV